MSRLIAAAALIVLVACHSGRPAGPAPGGAEVEAGVGGPGTICALGEHGFGEDRVAHACDPGLSCCYPCGIDGCDSVCMADCGPPRP